MPIDPSIPLQVRPFQMPDPVAGYARAMQLQNMQMQNQQAQRQYRMDMDTEDAFRAAGGDMTKAQQLLSERGLYKPAMAIGKQLTEQRTADANYQKTNLDMVRRRLELVGGALAAASQNPTRESVFMAAQQLHAQGVPGMAEALQSLPQDDAQIPAWIRQQMMATEQGRKALEAMQPKPQAFGADIRQANPMAPGYMGTIGQVSEQPGVVANRNLVPDPNRPGQFVPNQDLLNFKKQVAAAGAPSVNVNTGPMTPGKTASNEVDTSLLASSRSLMQLETISNQFKPEYQKFADKINFERLRLKDKTVGLNNKERSDLSEYATYRRNAFNTLNEYIKSITGAAMTNAEADRILKGLPSPGEGMFDGDSPTEFKSKLDDAIKQTKMAVARLAYIKRNGMSLDDGRGNAVVPLNSMPQLIRDRGRDIEADLRQSQPNADARALQSAVRRQLAAEFGLASD